MTWSPMFLIRWLHKWSGLVLGLQFLLWALSGAVMALLDHHKSQANMRSPRPLSCRLPLRCCR